MPSRQLYAGHGLEVYEQFRGSSGAVVILCVGGLEIRAALELPRSVAIDALERVLEQLRTG